MIPLACHQAGQGSRRPAPGRRRAWWRSADRDWVAADSRLGPGVCPVRAERLRFPPVPHRCRDDGHGHVFNDQELRPV